jgi:asparagine synthase (glutamine-hydrolysing)
MLPVAYWFRKQLHPFIKQVLANSHFVKQGIFNEAAVLRMIDEHKHNRVDHHVRLWMLLNLEIWHQLYIQEEDIAHVEEQLRSYL